jgi:ribosomal protein L24E
MASTQSGRGYWMVASDGGIFTFGDAGFYGSLGAVALSAPIEGMVTSDAGHGYWLVGNDGRVYRFGDAA